MSWPHFNVLVAGAVDLERMLSDNEITSVQIVQQYLAQIDRHETLLGAFISRAPRAKVLRAAARLDAERQSGSGRSRFHGIPIVLKDCFMTASSLGMTTTCGSLALVGSKSSRNSAIAQRLVDAGLIILGKTNMTEFAGMKMTMMMSGWSSHGGQTLSPYVGKIEDKETILGHSAPGGSSTGSAVAVAAGFAPLAMGTETIGSIITPASRHALYALKPTVGVQDTTGVFTLTDFYDSPGPMAKCAADVRAMASILLGRDFTLPDNNPWQGLLVGFVDPSKWTLPDELSRQHEGTSEQMVEDYLCVVSNLKKHQPLVKYPVDVPDISVLSDVSHLAHWDFKHITMPRFIQAFDECPMSSLEDIVEFNKANKARAMPAPYTEQDDLETSLSCNEDPDSMERVKKELRAKGRQVLDKAFDDNGVNLIVGPVDSAFCIHACAAGYPLATVPVGQLRYNGRPFGMVATARLNDEEALLRFQAAYEAAWRRRPLPDLSN
ncbi:Amidase signature domain protein [Ophiocordyceps sinensis CO18]|uniref:Amidase signature domain protein n=1 Tax=Ophiocordyceps sinensis (strain Co18 / CGMCC 3.14243) TaxID=911162 RepID=T5AF80_OPHSC|nr:Amidase signature domain protein [Ophiocordyceps sinensis CO18]